MKNLSLILLTATTVLLSSMPVFANTNNAKIVEACLVTEALAWGETLTTIRIEYSEEIESRAMDIRTFVTSNPRNVCYLYVNNSGKIDDAQPFGKYVFLKLVYTHDPLRSRDLVTFAGRERPKLADITVTQTRDVVTRQGTTLPAGAFTASKEIRTDIDSFTYQYRETVNGIDFGIMLYIPEGYDKKSDNLRNLPLVVHYPSGDHTGIDYKGTRTGALYNHNDATIWANEKSQKKNPCFVVTLGCSSGFPNAMYVTYDELWSHNTYYNTIKDLIATYNIDASRIYAVSLAGGTTQMWNTIMRHPDLFAASMSTSFDFYMSYTDPDISLANMKKVLDAVPNWFFSGLLDATGSDPFNLGRLKGERLRDMSYICNKDGYKIEVGYGAEGELMWDATLSGKEADALAQAQIARAAANGSTSLVTLFLPNTLPVSEHWSWLGAYTNSVVRDWLFAQSKKR